MKGRPWTKEDDAALMKLAPMNLRWREIGERLGRSTSACESRYALICTRAGLTKDARPVWSPIRTPNFDRPSPIRSDCDKHLELVTRASGGRGFPSLRLPAAYRVAA